MSKELEIKEYTYTIGRGANYAKKDGRPLIMKPFIGSELVYWCRIDEGARYDLDIDADQDDWNKLPGFTPCTIHHHTDSCRIGWRWNLEKECIELTPYLYVDGQRITFDDDVLEVQTNEWFGAWIKFTDDGWEVKLALAKPDILPMGKKDADMGTLKEYEIIAQGCGSAPARLQLNFYFGGGKTGGGGTTRSPNNISMDMRVLVHPGIDGQWQP